MRINIRFMVFSLYKTISLLIVLFFCNVNNIQALNTKTKKVKANYIKEVITSSTNKKIESLVIKLPNLQNKKETVKYIDKQLNVGSAINLLDHSSSELIKKSDEYVDFEKRYKTILDICLIFFFASGSIGFFISVALNLRRKGDTIANLLISLFVLLHSLFIIILCLYLSNYICNFFNIIGFILSSSFLYGPLLYFYFKRTTEQYIFKATDLLHLLPTVFLLGYVFQNYLYPSEGKIHFFYTKDTVFDLGLISIIVLKAISLVIYGVLVYIIYCKNKSKLTKHHSKVLKWQKNMMMLNLLYALVYLPYVICIFLNMPYIFIYTQSFLLSIIILYVGTVAYVQPEIFNDNFIFNKLKYGKSGLTDRFSVELKKELLKLFYEEKIYKKSDLTLEKLAERLGTTRHNVSQVINQHFDMNFFSLINKFRIIEATEILKNNFNNNLRIIDVAYDVGFNNKVTFNKAFKAEIKMTPSQFISKKDTLGFIS
tara:strand:- start:4176 stop:5627 length:1452 start_codon:yes stop_codon:yes gene_type:complete